LVDRNQYFGGTNYLSILTLSGEKVNERKNGEMSVTVNGRILEPRSNAALSTIKKTLSQTPGAEAFSSSHKTVALIVRTRGKRRRLQQHYEQIADRTVTMKITNALR
jgi:hypothetical protein